MDTANAPSWTDNIAPFVSPARDFGEVVLAGIGVCQSASWRRRERVCMSAQFAQELLPRLRRIQRLFVRTVEHGRFRLCTESAFDLETSLTLWRTLDADLDALPDERDVWNVRLDCATATKLDALAHLYTSTRDCFHTLGVQSNPDGYPYLARLTWEPVEVLRDKHFFGEDCTLARNLNATKLLSEETAERLKSIAQMKTPGR